MTAWPHSRWSKPGQIERGRASPTRDGYGQAIAVLDDHGSAGHTLAFHRTGIAIAPRCNDAPLNIVAAGLGRTLRRQREGCGGKLVEADPAIDRGLGLAMSDNARATPLALQRGRGERRRKREDRGDERRDQGSSHRQGCYHIALLPTTMTYPQSAFSPDDHDVLSHGFVIYDALCAWARRLTLLETAKQDTGQKQQKGRQHRLEAVSAHHRDSDSSVPHQESQHCEQHRKD